MPNQLLVAVKSSFEQYENGTHNMVRGTWAQKLRGYAFVRFFMGRKTQELGGAVSSLPGSGDISIVTRNSYVPTSDEVILDCEDGPESLVKKTRAICGYAMGKGLSHVLLVNAHTNVGVKEVLNAPYQAADYAGYFGERFGVQEPQAFWNGQGTEVIERCYGWAAGDSGIFLSRKAAGILADTHPRSSLYIDGKNDDVWIGNVLGPLVMDGELVALPTDPVAA
jgi:hypothetical protein